MTASRAIEAAQARLVALRDEESRLQGALSEVASCAREVPSEFAATVRSLVSTGELQRRWDWAQQRAERGTGTPKEALLQTITGFLGEIGDILAHRVLGDREMAVRWRAETIAAERRTLEWVVSEATARESSRPPPPLIQGPVMEVGIVETGTPPERGAVAPYVGGTGGCVGGHHPEITAR